MPSGVATATADLGISPRGSRVTAGDPEGTYVPILGSKEPIFREGIFEVLFGGCVVAACLQHGLYVFDGLFQKLCSALLHLCSEIVDDRLHQL